MSVRCYLIVVLMLFPDDQWCWASFHECIGHLSLEKCLFRSCAHFKIRFLFLWCWVVWVLCIIWTLTPYQIYCLQISSPIHRQTFHFVDSFLHCAKVFLVWCKIIFTFVSLAWIDTSKKYIGKTNIKERTAFVFSFLRGLWFQILYLSFFF